MFRKKYTVKEELTVAKRDAKKLRECASQLLGGGDFTDVLNAIWDSKASVSQRRWQFGPGVSVMLYLVNGLPLLLSVDGLHGDASELIPKGATSGIAVPTLFLILRAHQLLTNTPERDAELSRKVAVNVYCRGPTSRFILSGAHLMMPGIVMASLTDVQPGRLAFIYSIGTRVPYALGLTTSKFVHREASGVGIYVINSFMDRLWTEFEAVFMALCVDKSGKHVANPLPPEFGREEVMENLPEAAEEDESEVKSTEEETGSQTEASKMPSDAPTDEALAVDKATNEAADTYVAEAEGAHDDAAEVTTMNIPGLFPDEDAVMTFALCEALKSVQPHLLPMPLTQFTALVSRAFPRFNGDSQPVNFKKTKYKRALTFYTKFEDLITVRETSPGVHSLIEVNKSSMVLRDHKRKYKDFLDSVQKPAQREEVRAAEMRLVTDKKTVFGQKIESLTTRYYVRSRKHFPESLAHVMLAGNVREVIAYEFAPQQLPSLNEVEEAGRALAAPATQLPLLDNELYTAPYSRKALVDNLRQYVKRRNLLVMPTGENGAMPSVKLEGALTGVAAIAHAAEVELSKAQEIVLKMYFNVVTETVIQTSVSGTTAVSEFIPPRHTVKSGLPPTIHIWTKMRAGSKIITICKNLEALGFSLEALSRSWSKRFATSCSVVDPAASPHRLTSDTKIPLEIHVQGDIIAELSRVLVSELGIPERLVCNSK